MNKSTTGLSENLAGALSYVFGMVTGIVLLVVEKESKFVRFHAMQSVLCCLVMAVVEAALWVLGFIPIVNLFVGIVGTVVGIASFVAYVYLIYMAYKGQTFKVPVIGDVAWEQVNK